MTQFTILAGAEFSQLIVQVPKDAYYINGAYHNIATVELGINQTENYRDSIIKSIPYGDIHSEPFYYLDSMKYLVDYSLKFSHVYVIIHSDLKPGMGQQIFMEICNYLKPHNPGAILFEHINLPDFITDIQFATASSSEFREKQLRQIYIRNLFKNRLNSFTLIKLKSLAFIGLSPFRKRPININRLISGSFCMICQVDGDPEAQPLYIKHCKPSSIKFLSLNFVHHLNLETNEIGLCGDLPDNYNCMLITTSSKPTQMPHEFEEDASLRLESVSSTLLTKIPSFSDWKGKIDRLEKPICLSPNYCTSVSFSGVGGHPLRVRRKFQ
eukprot:NODE_323_length_9725_cov_0.840536.p4 type:complete len:326 gc:universal NODE_323_length_9725_cov_0.840536:8252-9229(+)